LLLNRGWIETLSRLRAGGFPRILMQGRLWDIRCNGSVAA